MENSNNDFDNEIEKDDMHENINDGECNELSCYLKTNFFEEFS